MKQQFEALQKWFQARTQRERLFFLIGSLAVIYLFWSLFFSRSATMEHKKLMIDIQTTQSEINKLNAEIQEIVLNGNSASNTAKLQEHARLNKELQQIEVKIIDSAKHTSPLENFNQTINAMLQVQSGIKFSNFKKLPMDVLNVPVAGAAGITLDKQGVQIEFNGHYFDVMHYLAYLEQLPSHLYWESMGYKTMTEQNAVVTVTLAILSKQKTEVPS